jgi:hypothetical protein
METLSLHVNAGEGMMTDSDDKGDCEYFFKALLLQFHRVSSALTQLYLKVA